DLELHGRRGSGLAELVHLARGLRDGEWQAPTALEISEQRPTGALVDSPRGVPYLVCWHAMQLAIAKAKEHGIAAVGARRGAQSLAPFLRLGVEHDLVTLAMCCGPAVIAPPGGLEPLIGNNPFGIGVPAGDEAPIILDCSWSAVSARVVMDALRAGRDLPPGIVQDADGNPSTEPRAFIETPSYEAIPSGTLLPAGGHKGYAMAVALGALVTCLLDVPPRRYLSHMGGTSGSLFICLDPALFSSVTTLKRNVDGYTRSIVQSRQRPGAPPIRYPGQQAHHARQRAWAAGRIDLPAASFDVLVELAAIAGVEGPGSR
ncbi:MAG TPA: Ldh family oxidoreductase, partial [Chloroflexota bacterium]|nr:Ldh family oxidoreductase [Chloroflexota bacterium]